MTPDNALPRLWVFTNCGHYWQMPAHAVPPRNWAGEVLCVECHERLSAPDQLSGDILNECGSPEPTSSLHSLLFLPS